jgi:hypothetical protein
MPIQNLLTVEGSGFMVDAEYFAGMVEYGFDADALDLNTTIWFEDEKVFIKFSTPDFPSVEDTLSRMSEVWPAFSFTLESNSGVNPGQRRVASRVARLN